MSYCHIPSMCYIARLTITYSETLYDQETFTKWEEQNVERAERGLYYFYIYFGWTNKNRIQ